MNEPYQHPRFQRGLFRSRTIGVALILGVAVTAAAAIGPVLWYVAFWHPKCSFQLIALLTRIISLQLSGKISSQRTKRNAKMRSNLKPPVLKPLNEDLPAHSLSRLHHSEHIHVYCNICAFKQPKGLCDSNRDFPFFRLLLPQIRFKSVFEL